MFNEYNIKVNKSDLDNFIGYYKQSQNNPDVTLEDMKTYIISGFVPIVKSKEIYYKEYEKKNLDPEDKNYLSQILSFISVYKPLPVFQIKDSSQIENIQNPQSTITKTDIVNAIVSGDTLTGSEIEIDMVAVQDGEIHDIDLLIDKPVLELRDEISADAITSDNIRITEVINDKSKNLSIIDIPIYIVVTTGTYGGHATLLILKNNMLYSVGIGYDGAGSTKGSESTAKMDDYFGNAILYTIDFILSLKDIISKNNIIDIGVFTVGMSERLNKYVSGAESATTSFKRKGTDFIPVSNSLTNIIINDKPLKYSYLSNSMMSSVNCTSWVLDIINVDSLRITCSTIKTLGFSDPSKCQRISGKLNPDNIGRIFDLIKSETESRDEIIELLGLLQYNLSGGGGRKTRRRKQKHRKLTRKRRRRRRRN
jgi:PKD repeat protein